MFLEKIRKNDPIRLYDRFEQVYFSFFFAKLLITYYMQFSYFFTSNSR
ncbi:hypothetical protein LEP1GSC083_1118 [Leptospira interrogans serovar Pyrogenes str. L0374]|uniref:Uncharacterized protein n=6 Tax=Leptospira interrogans TaxID=173 RepID=M6ZSN7_LEPIR|nr:hypothetical protein G436_1582 [Leptospira interrogans serovar Hardjo str. Norma]EJP14607.1 hypothetical protein LEP1GSC080_2286 [Leptospira interrogans str. FPW2026]EKO07486.1 hypothetical protein LEP1GSC077_3216 [Leptospira interrogans str. C10069]EKO25897.1 hypothetical protein LEP1GSC104_1753 [Leptospira interrogans str. UI 12621]EKO95601.1 hypothetical protein LEP1GSC057_1047 [Leptospira interrogans str. Brem 329]EKR19883.1 hypothetical protein LEP1GSC019_3919 [Leptospira interrogans s